MTAVALLVLFAGLLVGGYGFAAGVTADVMRVRFGGDRERTRVVVDLGGTARGTVVETGSGGRVVLTLDGVAPPRNLSGAGSGIVRGFRVGAVGTASRPGATSST